MNQFNEISKQISLFGFEFWEPLEHDIEPILTFSWHAETSHGSVLKRIKLHLLDNLLLSEAAFQVVLVTQYQEWDSCQAFILQKFVHLCTG